MDVQFFDNDYLRGHPLYLKCLALLNDVSERDYPGNNYFDKRIECLDMDTYEREVCFGQADCTIDAVIGISDRNNNRRGNRRLLLVELRMEYQSDAHLSETKLVKKIRHTRDLLGAALAIERKTWFVFSRDVAPQARFWVENKKNEGGGGEVKYFEVYSVDEFNESVQCLEDGYTPEIPSEIIKADISAYGLSGKWRELDKYIRWLLNYAVKKRRSNYAEYQNVKDAVKEAWQEVYREGQPYPDEDTEYMAMVLDEDINTILW